jgi:hypothetical protein
MVLLQFAAEEVPVGGVLCHTIIQYQRSSETVRRGEGREE